jgi:hypothetical protein
MYKRGASTTSEAIRQRRCRRRRRLLAVGFEPVELWLPKEVKAAWAARERIDNAEALLPLKNYPGDLVDVLVEWAQRLLAASHRDPR